MRTITEIIIHCTATRPDANCTVESIRRYHKSLGWRDIGYHYVIYPDGSVRSGRPIEEVGAHCPGHNAQSIGIAYVGGLDTDGHATDTRTEAQRLALLQLVRDLMEEHTHHLHPRPQRVCQPRLSLFRRPAMEKGEQTLTAESGIIYKIYKISCAHGAQENIKIY